MVITINTLISLVIYLEWGRGKKVKQGKATVKVEESFRTRSSHLGIDVTHCEVASKDQKENCILTQIQTEGLKGIRLS